MNKHSYFGMLCAVQVFIFYFFAWASYSDSNLLCVTQFSCIYIYIYMYIYQDIYIDIYICIHMRFCVRMRESDTPEAWRYVYMCVCERETKRERNRETPEMQFSLQILPLGLPLCTKNFNVHFGFFLFLFFT